jgi:phosphoribosylanthranilate isomerase
MAATVKVKICGVCSVVDARAVVDAGADLMGLNFHPASPRHVDLARAREIAAAAPGVPLVAVVVDLPAAEVRRLVDRLAPWGLQFHGDEDPAYCRGWPCTTIKAIRVRPGEDPAATAARYDTDYVLLDAFVPGVPGGTGVRIDPAAARGIDRERLVLAGGLTPETVADAVRAVRPFAVDVASGVERRPGVKDHAKVREFVRRARAA